MSVFMTGIDFNKASIDIRSKFSFTKKSAAAAMEKLKESGDVSGSIILSTCNRMEIWASIEDEADSDILYRFLCEEKNVPPEDYREYFVMRQGREAVEHLLYLTSGLKSQILAEDQILTQVSDALLLSRGACCTDSVLEVLFRIALTAAKKVKTEVVFSKANTSVIHQAIQKLKGEGVVLKGKKCMVIGNGAMGKLTALALTEEGVDVTVTVRQYRSGIVEIPQGCKRINYGDRMKLFPECDMVVSATASPNFTITKEEFDEAVTEPKNMIIIDLAVPRDIDVRIGKVPGISFYDIDSFRVTESTAELQESLDKAGKIIDEQMDRFYSWFSGRDMFPKIQEIRDDAVEDFRLRVRKEFRKTPMADDDRDHLLKIVDTAAGKVIIKMIFGLRESLKQESFAECIAGLQEIYDED